MDKRNHILFKESYSPELRKVLLRIIMTNTVIFVSYLVSLFFTLSFIPEGSLSHSLIYQKVGVISISFTVAFIISNYNIAMKIGEPMSKLVRYFKAVSKNKEITSLSFRKGDYFQDLPAIIVESYRRVLEGKDNDIDQAS